MGWKTSRLPACLYGRPLSCREESKKCEHPRRHRACTSSLAYLAPVTGNFCQRCKIPGLQGWLKHRENRENAQSQQKTSPNLRLPAKSCEKRPDTAIKNCALVIATDWMKSTAPWMFLKTVTRHPDVIFFSGMILAVVEKISSFGRLSHFKHHHIIHAASFNL